MATLGPRVLQELTEAQLRLVKRHGRALRRLAVELARRHGFDALSIMFILADTRGRIGGALRASVPLPRIGPVVLPSQAADLDAWVAQLARYAPVWDLRGTSAGTVVVVIDEHDAIAVTHTDLPVYRRPAFERRANPA